MIDRYLGRGEIYALFGGTLKSVCVITKERERQYEIKNVATWLHEQRKGYGTALLSYLFQKYAPLADWITVGTGNTPKTLGFYRSLGFACSHTLPGFFTRHCDTSLFEDSIRLTDIICLKNTCPIHASHKKRGLKSPRIN
ncbi:MAG: GNAT family N-acetyltransferase [Oxalobacter formigenes]|nr:GNAT family N-acetyltransferase [Oxalobacter formigenes]